MTNNKDIIEIYKDLYDLPMLTHKEGVSFDFFRLLLKDYKFIVISIYNERREFLLLRDLSKNIGWELVGGYLEKDEKIEDGVNRIVLREAGLIIDELQPIAIIENEFEWNGKIITHSGIAFAALARGRVRPQPVNIQTIYTREIPEAIVYQDKKILQKAKQIIENKISEPPYKEIEASKRFFLCYLINKYVVKFIGKFASRQIQNKIIELICNNPKSIIDVSCGDDDFIFKLEKLYNPELCVANDISWRTISLIKNKNKDSNTIFINHNVIALPFKRSFDLMIFKNTLHHIPTTERIDLIKRLLNLSKQLIIVDIEDPNRSNFLAKIWHWYYVYFLGDQGGSFLISPEFKEIIEKNIKDKKSTFGIINTIKGRYFYASLSEIIRDEEVEIKTKIEPSQIETIKRKLSSLGAVLKEKIKEKDSYFTAPHRDFIKTRECLRIRERDNFLELTYKGVTTKLMNSKKQFWKSEINLPLSCSKREIESLLEALNFKKIVEVIKEREKYELRKQNINLDNIKNLGWFLEVESTAKDEKERQKALDENMTLLRKLNLNKKDIVDEPYRDLVLKKK